MASEEQRIQVENLSVCAKKGNYDECWDILEALEASLSKEEDGELKSLLDEATEDIWNYNSRAEIIDDVQKKTIDNENSDNINTPIEVSYDESNVNAADKGNIRAILELWKTDRIGALKMDNKEWAKLELSKIIEDMRKTVEWLPDPLKTTLQEALEKIDINRWINEVVEGIEAFVKEREKVDETAVKDGEHKHFHFVGDAECIQFPYDDFNKVVDDLEKVIGEKIQEVCKCLKNDEGREDALNILQNRKTQIFEKLRIKDKERLKENLMKIGNQLKDILNTEQTA